MLNKAKLTISIYLLTFMPLINSMGQSCCSATNERKIIRSNLTVDELRSNIYAVESEKISVLGVLMPLTQEEKIVNAILVPDKDYLTFEPWVASSFSINLGGVIRMNGDMRINEKCYGEFVIVSGVASVFSGMPSIDVRLINNVDHGNSASCLSGE